MAKTKKNKDLDSYREAVDFKDLSQNMKFMVIEILKKEIRVSEEEKK